MVVKGVGVLVSMIAAYLRHRSVQPRGLRLEAKARVLTSRNGRRDTSLGTLDMYFFVPT